MSCAVAPETTDSQGPAWNTLAHELRRYIARRVKPDDVDDVLQDTLLRIHRGLDTLHEAQRFGPWVHQVTRTAVVDHLRARGRRGRLGGEDKHLDDLEAPPGEAATTEAEALLAGVIVAFVADLPSPYREALTLTELQGLTQRDAAAALGLSVSGMKSRVQRGRAQLRTKLEACCAIETDVRGRVIGCTPRPDGVGPTSCACHEQE